MIPRSNADSIISLFLKSEVLVAIVLINFVVIVYNNIRKRRKIIKI